MRKMLYCCLGILLVCCKEKYIPRISSPDSGYLVVDGYINATGPAEIRLAHTLPLQDTTKTTYETQAQVLLQGDDNSSYPLTESSKGVYTNNGLTLNKAHLYRLFIKTKAGTQYASEYVKVKNAPEIGAIDWAFERDGLQLYVNTSDPNNNTWYYRWETDETWEFHSRYQTQLQYVYGPEGDIVGTEYRRPDKQPDTTLYYCWQRELSTNVLLGSSARLNQDSMHFPLIHIPNNDWKLGVLYSLYITQYALSKEEYEYLQKIKNNSEASGSIFDRQPSELIGNIHCLTVPDEIVIGFIGIANRQQKRFWIKNSDIPNWRYNMTCFYDIIGDFLHQNMIPLYYVPPGFAAAEADCVDCRLRGSNVKPTFWP